MSSVSFSFFHTLSRQHLGLGFLVMGVRIPVGVSLEFYSQWATAMPLGSNWGLSVTAAAARTQLDPGQGM